MAKRASNGDGTIRKRKDGRFEYRVVVGTDMKGNPIRKSFYADGPTKAKNLYKAWLQNEKTPIERVQTVAQWAEQWLEIYKKDKIAYKSYVNYKMYIEKHIVPALGALKLDSVRPAHLEQFYQSKMDLSRYARRDLDTILRGVFGSAVDNHLCTTNPALKADPQKGGVKKVDVFTPDEIKKILAFADTHKYGAYIQLLLYSGLRMGEVLALQWGDIDFNEELLTIRHAIAASEDGPQLKGTKTDRIRYVGISPQLQKALQSFPKYGLFVLADEKGRHRTPSHFRNAYKQFFFDLNDGKKDQVRYLSPHKCRHTFATYVLRGGANLREVQSLLGHSTVKSTEIYTHINTDDVKKSVLKLAY